MKNIALAILAVGFMYVATLPQNIDPFGLTIAVFGIFAALATFIV